jgi:hypothetical protein
MQFDTDELPVQKIYIPPPYAGLVYLVLLPEPVEVVLKLLNFIKKNK